MSLAGWLKNGWLRPHKTSASEVATLLALVDRDLADSSKDVISSDWRFNMAYNALLQTAILALAAEGFEPEKGGQHHYRALQSLSETLGVSKDDLVIAEAFRKKRNIAEYDRIGAITDGDLRGVREMAARLRQSLVGWLGKSHPELLAKSKKP